MKTLTASILLSVVFIAAGGFAGAHRTVQPATMATGKSANVTIVAKTAAWPPPDLISVAPGDRNHGVDI